MLSNAESEGSDEWQQITEIHVETMAKPQPTTTIAVPLSLLDLPPDVRNDIYHFALLTVRPLRVEEGDRARAPPASQKVLTPALLLTCRTIWKDAAAILYWNHAFVGHAHALGTFVRRLSIRWDWSSRLRYLKVDEGMSQKDLVYLLASLREATGLKYLGIFYRDVYPGNRPKEMAKKLESLARAFQTAKEGRAADFVYIIDFYGDHSGSRWPWAVTRPGRHRARTEYTRQVKLELTKLLGLASQRHNFSG
ncbi:hypothetical protein AC579_7156 [Pseudocercospora musae]|uniref:F-box domain-containing protein n=1 Tax=Pseudocercospora musae TaxID=113226 RepID=A0A139HB94_9PEZI|nr:hypothetical protein AC579_7156 [Pseudocercospora musae]